MRRRHWDQVQENFDLVFARMNDLGAIQQDLKKQMEANNQKVDKCAREQQFIAQQVRANGQAVAQLTVQQFEEDAHSQSDSSVSGVFEEEALFSNVFATDKPKGNTKAGTSRHHRPPQDHRRIETLPHHTLSKIQFPKFEGEQPISGLTNATTISTSTAFQKHYG